MSNIRILVAEDHHIVREGVTALMKSQPDFSVVGEAADGIEALDLAKKLRPDVLLLDLMMPGLNGLEITRQVCSTMPEIAVVILSMHDDEQHVLESLKSGASAYVLKNSRSPRLLLAIREAAAAKQSDESRNEGGTESPQRLNEKTQDALQSLTKREEEIFKLIAQGKTNAHIAEKLAISTRTVEAHRANMMMKLGIHSQAELLHFAWKKGILR